MKEEVAGDLMEASTVIVGTIDKKWQGYKQSINKWCAFGLGYCYKQHISIRDNPSIKSKNLRIFQIAVSARKPDTLYVCAYTFKEECSK